MDSEKLAWFLDDLSGLCVKHGIGIANGTPFVMEEEDYRLFYVAQTKTILAPMKSRIRE